MTARDVGLSAVAAAVIAAVGLGGYLAGRSSPSTTAEAVTAAPIAPAPEGSDAAAAKPAVTETEGVITPAPASTPVEPPAAAPSSAPARREPVAAPVPPPRPAPSTQPAAQKPAASTARSTGTPARNDSRTTPPAAPVTAPRDETRPAATEPAVHDAPVEPPRDVKPADEHVPAVVEPPAPPTPKIEEFVVPADSVIGLQLDDTISSETARVEQKVEAHVTRDVRVNGTIVIPAGSRAHGQVTVVEPGGKFRERARLGVRFHTLVLADGSSVPIQTDAIYREGDAVGQRSAARIGGSAVGGAIIGAIFGGGKGAAIGAAAGAGAGTAATMATQKSQATLHAGSTVTVRLTNPATVSVERED